MVERYLLSYTPPPLSILAENNDYHSSTEEYKEKLEIIEQDLKWLLKLAY